MTSPSKFALGFFALFAAAVGLARGLSDKEFYRLTRMKKIWGRNEGITFFFLADVALPLVMGLAYVSSGVAESGVLYLSP
ncbi:hypothetical protein SAMN05660860_02993 [Geoalkalibacter ferrihydriticus]|uniref:Uncharacterized protein n=2 Tax=Geoalkalibacter ferrihydriticus TaxID=392333 RepID=A0A0C2EB72_9BACT|nr:hypothetical protein [Geoalkalibacter ferrihydriticus]KIH75843.1 hypothetical protein GFER_14770 [Geoalkalibacter ferrihydriticus DSM 17813]SDM67705.1 hypothetical protein SAMN05660860_02993 [Geoalkalibacter ferrihydriticus]